MAQRLAGAEGGEVVQASATSPIDEAVSENARPRPSNQPGITNRFFDEVVS